MGRAGPESGRGTLGLAYPGAGSWSEGTIHLYFPSSVCWRKTFLFPVSFLSHMGSLYSLTHKMGTNNLLHSSEAGYQLRFERLVFSNCLLILLFGFFSKALTSGDLPEGVWGVR